MIATRLSRRIDCNGIPHNLSVDDSGVFVASIELEFSMILALEVSSLGVSESSSVVVSSIVLNSPRSMSSDLSSTQDTSISSST